MWQFDDRTVPALRTPLPGPNARALLERDAVFVSPSYTRVYPLVVERGSGCVIEDVDGNLFLDFTAGIAVTATGHCHPEVVAAIHDQSAKLVHMSGTDFYYRPQIDLSERLAKSAPGPSPKKVFFTNSGAEAIEAALKLARWHTKRNRVVSFFGAFHGRTYGAMSLSGSKLVHRRGFSPLVPDIHHVEFVRECPGTCRRSAIPNAIPNAIRNPSPERERRVEQLAVPVAHAPTQNPERERRVEQLAVPVAHAPTQNPERERRVEQLAVPVAHAPGSDNAIQRVEQLAVPVAHAPTQNPERERRVDCADPPVAHAPGSDNATQRVEQLAVPVAHAPGSDNATQRVDCALVANIAETIFRRTCPPEEVAAIFIEPIQGEGGYHPVPAGCLPALRELCDRHGILLVVDEVQSGMGRTGKMFAVEHYGVEPDIICSAKGIASGLPLGAIIARAAMMDWPSGSHASTFGGNPVSCRAALATMDLLEREYLANATARGEQLRAGLRELARSYSSLAGVRGLGLMTAVDLLHADGSFAPALRERVVQAAFHRGLLLLGCGESAIRFCPPLCVTEAEVATALRLLDGVLAEVLTVARV